MKFKLETEELKKLNEWIKKLPKASSGAIGGRLTYSFTPTSLGMVIKVTDEISKQTIDLSDYDRW